MKELLGCPICGNQPIVINNNIKIKISCCVSMQRYKCFCPLLEDVIDQWNTRADIKPILKERKFGCHVDLFDGNDPDDCVLDHNKANDCAEAIILLKHGQGRDDCKHWKEIK